MSDLQSAIQRMQEFDEKATREEAKECDAYRFAGFLDGARFQHSKDKLARELLGKLIVAAQNISPHNERCDWGSETCHCENRELKQVLAEIERAVKLRGNKE